MRNRYSRAMIFSAFLIFISLFNFMHLEGRELVTNIQIVTLLVCGAAAGIFLQNLFGFLVQRRKH